MDMVGNSFSREPHVLFHSFIHSLTHSFIHSWRKWNLIGSRSLALFANETTVERASGGIWNDVRWTFIEAVTSAGMQVQTINRQISNSDPNECQLVARWKRQIKQMRDDETPCRYTRRRHSASTSEWDKMRHTNGYEIIQGWHEWRYP